MAIHAHKHHVFSIHASIIETNNFPMFIHIDYTIVHTTTFNKYQPIIDAEVPIFSASKHQQNTDLHETLLKLTEQFPI